MGNTWQTRALELWYSNKSVKAIARELGKSNETVKEFYWEQFGENSIKERGDKLRAENQGEKSIVTNRNLTEVTCAKSGKKFHMDAMKASKTKACNIIHPDYDTRITCEYCGIKIKNELGYKRHLARMVKLNDVQHANYISSLELEKQEKEIQTRVNRSVAATVAHSKRESESYKGKKEVVCPECNKNKILVSKFASPSHLKHLFCGDCKKVQSELRIESFKNGEEGVDYLKCGLCDEEGKTYLTQKSLISHLNNIHPNVTHTEYKKRYGSLITEKMSNQFSEERKGRTHKVETRLKQQANGGWSCGLTKEIDDRIQKISESTTETFIQGTRKGWNDKGYNLTRADLEDFIKNGILDIPTAAATLGASEWAIRQAAGSLEIPHHNKFGKSEKELLQTISSVLGDFPYIHQAAFNELRYYKSGYPFLYDGYFPEPYNLLVEYDGYQHFQKDNCYHRDEREFQEAQEKDKVKTKTAKNYGYKILRFKYDESIDPITVKKKLRQIFKSNVFDWQKDESNFTLNLELPKPSASNKQAQKQFQCLIDYYKWFFNSFGFPYDSTPLSKEICKKELNKSYSVIPSTNTSLSAPLNSYFHNLYETSVDGRPTPIQWFWENLEKLIINRIKTAESEGKKISKGFFRTGIKILGHCARNFNPLVAKYLIEKYNGTDILDPCAGFGGRLLGAYISQFANSYTGVDPNTQTVTNLLKLSNDLLEFNCKRFDSQIQPISFEDFSTAKTYNLILTSPPYFNKELYSNERSQSISRYSEYHAWKDSFLQVLVEKSYNFLQDGCYAIYMLNNTKYPIKDDFLQMMQKQGFEFVREENYKTPHVFNKDHTDPILVFRKSIN